MRELIRLTTAVEVMDLQLYLGLNGVVCQVPDQFSLGISTISTPALATGRVLVANQDYEYANELLKDWTSPYQSKAPDRFSRILENPRVLGISPSQILEGLKAWSSLNLGKRIFVLGGIMIYAISAAVVSLLIWTTFSS